MRPTAAPASQFVAGTLHPLVPTTRARIHHREQLLTKHSPLESLNRVRVDAIGDPKGHLSLGLLVSSTLVVEVNLARVLRVAGASPSPSRLSSVGLLHRSPPRVEDRVRPDNPPTQPCLTDQPCYTAQSVDSVQQDFKTVPRTLPLSDPSRDQESLLRRI